MSQISRSSISSDSEDSENSSYVVSNCKAIVAQRMLHASLRRQHRAWMDTLRAIERVPLSERRLHYYASRDKFAKVEKRASVLSRRGSKTLKRSTHPKPFVPPKSIYVRRAPHSIPNIYILNQVLSMETQRRELQEMERMEREINEQRMELEINELLADADMHRVSEFLQRSASFLNSISTLNSNFI